MPQKQVNRGRLDVETVEAGRRLDMLHLLLGVATLPDALTSREHFFGRDGRGR